MTRRLTSIHLKSADGGSIAEWGRKSPSEMIALIREHARYELAVAQQILAAPDDAFCITTYTGVFAHKNFEVLQAGEPSSHRIRVQGDR